MTDDRAEAERKERVCPQCGAEVPEHWWAMGVCPVCNSSLAAPGTEPGPADQDAQPVAPPEPSASPARVDAADDAAMAVDARRQFIDVLDEARQRKAAAAKTAVPPPQPLVPSPPERAEPAAEPAEAAPQKSKKGIIAILVAIGAILLKFKGPLLILLGKLKWLLPALKVLKFGKILTTGGSMIVSAALYATIFGWPYAVGLVLLILVHEMGHMLVIWGSGLPTSAPIFIPFFGAAIFWKEMPRDAKVESAIAFGGPVLGTVGALACYGIYLATHAPLWLALAYLGCFINLLNMLPVLPLDGGRIMAAVSPKVWLIGMVGIVIFFIKFHSPLLLLLVLLSLPRLVEAFRRHRDPEKMRYYDVPRGTRVFIAVAYFALAGFLGYLMLYAFETIG